MSAQPVLAPESDERGDADGHRPVHADRGRRALLHPGLSARSTAASLNWDFFTKLPAPVGEPGGGMANAIVGSGKVLLLATLIGVPIGFLGGVYLAEFGGSAVLLRGPLSSRTCSTACPRSSSASSPTR